MFLVMGHLLAQVLDFRVHYTCYDMVSWLLPRLRQHSLRIAVKLILEASFGAGFL